MNVHLSVTIKLAAGMVSIESDVETVDQLDRLQAFVRQALRLRDADVAAAALLTPPVEAEDPDDPPSGLK